MPDARAAMAIQKQGFIFMKNLTVSVIEFGKKEFGK